MLDTYLFPVSQASFNESLDMTDDKRFTEMNLFTLFLIRESSKQEYETLAETDPTVFGARRSIASL